MRRLLAIGLILAAVALTLGAGILHGRFLHRWGANAYLDQSRQRLAEFPDQFGSWTLVKRDKLAADAESMLQCSGYLLRTYINQKSGETVTVAVMQGPAGPISVHTPEICYSSRNFKIVEKRSVVAIGDEGVNQSKLWALTFQSNSVDESLQRVYYGWTTDGRWKAPKSSRFAFAGQPYLYKVQLASLPKNLAEQDPCEGFLEEFLPELNRRVFSPLEG